MTAKSGKGNVNDQFRSIIIDLVNRSVLEIKNSKDITTYKINELIRCNYNPFTETEDMKSWLSVYHDNYLKLILLYIDSKVIFYCKVDQLFYNKR